MSKKFVIMFVCTGNTCRSPMAEGALKHLLNKKSVEDFEIISSGTMQGAGFPATLYAIEAAKTWDVDISGHLSQPLTPNLIEKSDLIIAMTPGHTKEILKMRRDAAGKIYLFKNFPDNSPDGEGIADPIGMSLEEYNKTFLELGESLGQHLDEIIKRIKGKQNAG